LGRNYTNAKHTRDLRGKESLAAGTAASTERESAVQRLSWRGFAVGKNFGNDRRKIINAGARHDDAVPAPMSFLNDTQEFTAVVLPELDVEVLALNLQFSRLDDVVHFALRPPSLGSGTLKWKKNPRPFKGISYRVAAGQNDGD
jgi:hypothetical protein